MPKVKTINTAELAVGEGDIVIKTNSIGSCVVIALYDKTNKVGGMAHAMLPSRKSGSSSSEFESEAKFADESIDRLVEKIENQGGSRSNLVAKLVGGAKMFKVLSGDKHGIGDQNVESAKNKLESLGIKIENEVTGGSVGRMASFNTANGILEINTKV